MRTARNVAIVLGLAAIVAFVPGGGNASDTVLAALWMAFLVAIAFSLYVFAREREMTMASLTDSARMLLYGALGLIVLLIAGQEEMFASGGGTLLWLILLGVSIAAIWRVWTETQSY